jgi:hypothetical protein
MPVKFMPVLRGNLVTTITSSGMMSHLNELQIILQQILQNGRPINFFNDAGNVQTPNLGVSIASGII